MNNITLQDLIKDQKLALAPSFEAGEVESILDDLVYESLEKEGSTEVAKNFLKIRNEKEFFDMNNITSEDQKLDPAQCDFYFSSIENKDKKGLIQLILY